MARKIRFDQLSREEQEAGLRAFAIAGEEVFSSLSHADQERAKAALRAVAQEMGLDSGDYTLDLLPEITARLCRRGLEAGLALTVLGWVMGGGGGIEIPWRRGD
jgi:hypothetical protein